MNCPICCADRNEFKKIKDEIYKCLKCGKTIKIKILKK